MSQIILYTGTRPIYEGKVPNSRENIIRIGLLELLPEQCTSHYAEELVLSLKNGLSLLERSPDHFLRNEEEPGLYRQLVSFVKGMLQVCEMYPGAEIELEGT